MGLRRLGLRIERNLDERTVNAVLPVATSKTSSVSATPPHRPRTAPSASSGALSLSAATTTSART